MEIGGGGGRMRGKPSPVLPPPGDRVMEGGPQHPSSTRTPGHAAKGQTPSRPGDAAVGTTNRSFGYP